MLNYGYENHSEKAPNFFQLIISVNKCNELKTNVVAQIHDFFKIVRGFFP